MRPADRELADERDDTWADPGRRPSRRRAAVLAGLMGAGVIGAAMLAYDPPPEPLPSLFGLDAAQAEDLLEARGHTVELRPARACEPRGLALGTDPPVGTVAAEGSRVTVRFAVPADVFCMAAYEGRVAAWQLVAFARGGPAPELATEVLVVRDGTELTLSGSAPQERSAWDDALAPLVTTGEAFAPTTSGMARLSVDTRVSADDSCAPTTPARLSGRSPLRIRIESTVRRPADTCPLVVDLYRDAADRLDAVVVASAE